MNIVNSFADQWWPYVYHAMWQASLVAAIALAVVTVFRRLPSPWRYALLLIALVKFAIPPVLTTSFGVFHWTGPVVRVQDSGVTVQSLDAAAPAATRPPPAQAVAPTIGNPQSPIANLTSQISNLSWQSWLMLLHAAGTLLVLLWIARGFYHLARLTRRAELVKPRDGHPWALLHARFTTLAKRLDLKDDIDLLITDAPIPPVAFGLVRPKVMLPRPLLDQLTPQQLDTILAHELVHHRRNDPAANFFQLLLLAGWWFNPLLWLLHRTLSRTREECCDDALLGSNLATADGYAQTLLHTARQLTTKPPLGATLGFAERLHPMGNRLKRILDPALKRVPRLSPEALVIVAVLGVAVLPGLRTTAGRAAAEPPEPVKGVVLTPDGKSAASVAVKLIEPGGIVSFVEHRSLNDRGHQSTVTDEQGRFAVTPRSNTWMIVFDHDAGYAKADSDNPQTDQIELQPWGRIRGTLRIGNKPGRNETIGGSATDRLAEQGPFASFSYETTTDEEGTFVLDRVRPGKVFVGRKIQVSERSWLGEVRRRIVVKPGETADVTIGGEGRPVIGKVIAPDLPELDYQHSTSYLSQSQKFRQATGQFVALAFKIGPDGRFRIEDVPGGIYGLSIDIYDHERGHIDPKHPNFIAAEARRLEIVIPAVESAGYGEPIDLGTIELRSPETQERFIGPGLGRERD